MKKSTKCLVMLVDSALNNLGVFMSHMAIPIAILSQNERQNKRKQGFEEVGWTYSASFLLSFVAKQVFLRLGNRFGFGTLRFHLNAITIVVHTFLAGMQNPIELFLAVVILRGLVAHVGWVAFNFYTEQKLNQYDTKFLVESTVNSTHLLHILSPAFIALCVSLGGRDGIVALVVSAIIFGITLFPSLVFVLCEDEKPQDPLPINAQSVTSRQKGQPHWEIYKTEETKEPEEEPEEEMEEFFDLPVSDQIVIIFFVFQNAASSIMTIMFQTWYIPIGMFVFPNDNSVFIPSMQLMLYFLAFILCINVAVRNKFLSELEDHHLGRFLIAALAILQVVFLEIMQARSSRHGSLNTWACWILMFFVGILQGLHTRIQARVLQLMVPKDKHYYPIVRRMTAIFKRFCPMGALLGTGFFLSSLDGRALYYSIDLSLVFAPLAMAIIYFLECVEWLLLDMDDLQVVEEDC